MKKRARENRIGGEDEDEDEDEDESSEDEDEVDNLFRATGGKKRPSRKGLLKAGEIDIDRVRDANQVEASSVSSKQLA